MSDRSCAEILSLLLKHGQWFPSAIEIDGGGHAPGAREVSWGEDLEAEARRAVERETGKPAPERE